MIDSTIKSSQVMCRALGLQPAGVAATESGVCALCGAGISVGDISAPLKLGPAFMDDLELACRGSKLVCGWCVPFLAVEGLRATGYGVFSMDGYKPFRKWADIAGSLTNPPEPPFVIVHATANNQHMAWRAPVNWSRDMFYARIGLRDLKIRRDYLMGAVGACERLGAAIDAANPGWKKNPDRKMASHPFLGFSKDLKDGAEKHGRIKTAAYELIANDPSYQDDLEYLVGLTLGESWGLLFLLVHNDELIS